MSIVAIEINDIGVRAFDADGERFDSPGFAYTDGSVETGSAARSQARLQPGRVFNHFWHDLSLEALPGTVRGADSSADLAYHHLQALTARAGNPQQVLLAVPGHYSREQLSLLLGIARECKLPVLGIVDMALVAAARPVPGRQLIHIELGLHHSLLTRLTQGRRLRRDRVTAVPEAGQLALHDSWARAIADQFVRNTRYDPMHSAEAEQQVYDRLPDWVAQVHRDGKATLTVGNGDREHAASIRDEALAQAAQPALRQIVRRIAATSQPGEPLTLLLSDRLVAVPGLHATLSEAIPGVELVDLPPGSAAIGALGRAGEIAGSDDEVAFVTSVSWDASMARVATPPVTPRPDNTVPPTHVVYAGRAWPIGEQPLQIGAEPAADGPGIVVAGDTRGVSRRHCSLRRNGTTVVLSDHSRHGTFVNDRRVDGDTGVNYGDLVRLGSGGQFLQLIVEQAGHGA